ncbi:MAG: oxidoreductase, partial [Pseudomonadota bacterium]
GSKSAGIAGLLADRTANLTGGFKTLGQAEDAIANGQADMVGLARALVIDPELPSDWLSGQRGDLRFPRFSNPPEGGVTAWYTMQITRQAKGDPLLAPEDLAAAMAIYEERDAQRRNIWATQRL